MTRQRQRLITVLNSVSANGAGSVLEVDSYEFITIQLATTGDTTATIKFAVSLSTIQPNFGIAPSATNIYDYVQITPVSDDATPIVGTTGIVLTGTDVIKLYVANIEYVKWLCPIVSGHSAGTILCQIDAGSNSSRN